MGLGSSKKRAAELKEIKLKFKYTKIFTQRGFLKGQGVFTTGFVLHMITFFYEIYRL